MRPRRRCLTRRELLRRAAWASGAGLATAGRGGCSRDQAAPATDLAPAGAQAAALRRQGEAGHPPVHERRAVAGRHVRPQAAARQVRTASRCRTRTCRTERKTGAAFPSPFKFQKYGQSGHRGQRAVRQHAPQHVDDICVIRSMHADVPNHEPSLLLMNCGDAAAGRGRASGSWVTYGLGTENQNLPGFVAMCPGGYPIQETQNWQAGVPAGRLPGHVHRHQAHATSRS